MLSTVTVMGYLIRTPINNKIAQKNSILQHTSVIADYSASVTDSVKFYDFKNAKR